MKNITVLIKYPGEKPKPTLIRNSFEAFSELINMDNITICKVQEDGYCLIHSRKKMRDKTKMNVAKIVLGQKMEYIYGPVLFVGITKGNSYKGLPKKLQEKLIEDFNEDKDV